jgi:hypothetical protein
MMIPGFCFYWYFMLNSALLFFNMLYVVILSANCFRLPVLPFVLKVS